MIGLRAAFACPGGERLLGVTAVGKRPVPILAHGRHEQRGGELTGTRTRQRPAEGSCRMSSLSDGPQAACVDSRVPVLQDLMAGAEPGQWAFVLAASRNRVQQSRNARRVGWRGRRSDCGMTIAPRVRSARPNRNALVVRDHLEG